MKVRTLVSVALAVALSSSYQGRVFAQDVPVFDRPPSATELADILFPEKTRSIVIEDEPPGASAASDGAGSTSEGIVAEADGQATGAFGLLINFEFGNATMLPGSRAYLDSVGEMLNLERARNQSVVIEGHTDAIGDAAYNQKLSEMRALAVRRYLVSVHGIDVRRLHPVGLGEKRLHDPDAPTNAINRRVEFRRLDREAG